MSKAAQPERRVLARPVLLYQTVKTSRKFHAPDCDCTGQGDETSTAETTVRGALAMNYHPAGCVAPEVRKVLEGETADREERRTEASPTDGPELILRY